VPLTLADLTEFRRRETDSPGLTQPPASFLQDLPAYMARVQQEAGPDAYSWPEDGEAFSAISALDDIFSVRRYKLLMAARDNEPPAPKLMFDCESNAWFGLRRTIDDLDKATRAIIMGAGP